MTLLVGVIGSDGIVLVADQCRMRPAISEVEFDDRMLGRKITHLERYKTAYAVSGDDITDRVAHGLLEDLETGNLKWDSLEHSLEKIVKRRIAELQEEGDRDGGETERTLLIVFYGDQVAERQLWRVRVHRYPSAKRVDGITTCGAAGNSARFFEYYFEPNLPISELLPLASHIVLMGSRLDRLMVEGLDIAVFDRAGQYQFFNESDKLPLRKRSERLDALIRKRLKTPIPSGA